MPPIVTKLPASFNQKGGSKYPRISAVARARADGAPLHGLGDRVTDGHAPRDAPFRRRIPLEAPQSRSSWKPPYLHRARLKVETCALRTVSDAGRHRAPPGAADRRHHARLRKWRACEPAQSPAALRLNRCVCRLPIGARCCGASCRGLPTDPTGGFGARSSGPRMSVMGRLRVCPNSNSAPKSGRPRWPSQAGVQVRLSTGRGRERLQAQINHCSSGLGFGRRHRKCWAYLNFSGDVIHSFSA